MPRVITIVSGKGGTGKSMICANLGVAISSLGYKTLLLDADLSMANLGMFLGMDKYHPTLNDVLLDKIKLHDAISTGPKNVDVLPADIFLKNSNKISVESLEPLIEVLISKYDFILIDAPSGLNRNVIISMMYASELLIVTNSEISAISDAIKTIQIAKKLEKNILGIILNKYNKYTSIPIHEIETLLEMPIISVIPYEKEIYKYTSEGVPSVIGNPNSGVSKGIMRLAANLTNEELVEDDDIAVVQRILSLFARFSHSKATP